MKRPIFVDFNAENGIFRYKRSDKTRTKMVDTLNSIIDECKNSNPQLITFIEAGGKMTDGTIASCELIKTTGEGDRIAEWSDTCEDFVNKYKTILISIWTIIGLVWVYLLRDNIQDIWIWIVNVINKIIK
ncbi:MAG: hypothetical protein HY451_01215 [Parcubacteria group bacterium]|nr:hypothetical protein [Parcubacteria group bacterium]